MAAPVGSAPLTVAFRTFGCKVNRVESEDAAASLLGRGVRLVAEEDAAVIVVNTCTVTAEADRKARKAVRHALALPHSPVVVAAGCLASTGGEMLAALGDRVVVEADRERVAQRVADLLGVPESDGRAGRGGDDPLAATRPVRSGEGFRTRAAVKVADGCDAFCAYCIVPFARGLPRSVPLADVVAEVERLVAAGSAEVVLTGINIGRYDGGGGSPDATVDLADLVSAVAATGVARIRISSIEPLDLTDRFLEVLSATPVICPHLHVPLQSGSDTILEAMGRTYTLEGYTERIAAARAALPGLAVTTDVLVGFPGERGEDAGETLCAVEAIGFSRLHVFRYSKRPGTRAAEMSGQVPAEVAAARAAALRDADARLREAYAASRLGGVAEVLVEEVDVDGVASGTTSDYLAVRIRTTAAPVRPGEMVLVRLAEGAGQELLGDLL